MPQCTIHPEIAAIEKCEVCGDELCGLCLWYTADGRRLCVRHAADERAEGRTVFSPSAYADAIPATLAAAPATAEATPAQYQGNSTDLGALIAAVLGVTMIASCSGLGYCIPVLAVILGAALYSNADQALDPVRTRRLALTGIGTGGCLLLIVLSFITLYFGSILFAIALSATGAGP